MDDYYVYGHYTKVGNNLFYIGKGRGKRKDSKHSRSISWNNFVEENEWYSCILFSGLTEQDALRKESLMLESFDGTTLVNRIKSSATHAINYEDFNKYFYYDETSPTGLRWKIHNGQRNHSKRLAGDVAGYLSKGSKYNECAYRVGLLGKEFKVHRIVYCLVHKRLDQNLVIDHVDGNPLNNKIENLRETTQIRNCRNSKKRSDNITGATCVTFVVDRHTGKTYCKASYLPPNEKRKSKFFSVEKYGILESFDMACNWRNLKIKKLASDGYTERHGK